MNQTSLVGRPLAALTAAMVDFAQKRGAWSGPLSVSSPEVARIWDAPRSATGITVSESSALTYSAFWACVNNISTDVASLPLILYKRLPNGGKERLTDHKLYRILHDEPNPEMSSMTFRETLQAHILTWGNGYAEIVRDGAGRPKQLWPLTPNRVSVRRDARTDAVYYEVSREDGGIDRIPYDDMFHIPGLGYDGMMGYSVVALAREGIGLGLATERFGGTFFGNGASFGGVISLGPGDQLTEPARKNFREMIDAQHQGVERAHKFLLLGNQAKYERMGIPPNDAQFLETRLHQVEDTCRWFRMPPHKIQHLLRSTNNNIEHQGIEYSTDCLLPWSIRWEQTILRKLIAPSERTIQFAEHKIEGVQRGDLQSRYAAYAVGRSWGWLSANDVRALENMNPLPSGGDMYLVPQNMAPADRMGEIIDKLVAPDPKPVAPASNPRSVDPEEMAHAIRTALTDVEARIMETTAKITTADADAIRWKDSADSFKAEAETHRQDKERLEGEAARLNAALLLANERGDRIAGEKQQAETAAAASLTDLQQQLRAANDAMARTSKAHLDAVAESNRLTAELLPLVPLPEELDKLRAESALVLHAAQAEAEQKLADQIALVERTRAAEADAIEECTRLRAQLDTAEHDKADAAALNEKLSGDTVKASEAVIAVRSECEDAEQRAIVAQSAAAAEALRAASESDRLVKETAAHAETWAKFTAAKQAEGDRQQAMIATHRDLVLDAMARLMWKETERARKNSGTPSKLTAWATSFYDLHEDTCVDGLRSAMRTHLVFIGSAAAVDEYTRALVHPLLHEAQAQLTAVAQVTPDDFPVLVERLLTRWERERPIAVANQIHDEEVSYVRSL